MPIRVSLQPDNTKSKVSHHISCDGTKGVGAYIIGGNYYIHVRERPTDEQILNVKKMFGWDWKDYNG